MSVCLPPVARLGQKRHPFSRILLEPHVSYAQGSIHCGWGANMLTYDASSKTIILLMNNYTNGDCLAHPPHTRGLARQEGNVPCSPVGVVCLLGYTLID